MADPSSLDVSAAVEYPLADGSRLVVRPVGEQELGTALAVAAEALGWDPQRPNDELFRWKHLENPFGRSDLWLAEVDGQPVGLRAFMAWEFVDYEERSLRAVRAVDTATLPAARRKGVFRIATTHALVAAHRRGVDFVFNTPNSSSRPGYLSMGWEYLGRPPIEVLSLGIGSLPVLAKARTAADKWSIPTDVGLPAAEALWDETVVRALLLQRRGSRLATRWTPERLRWRYGSPHLHYKVVTADGAVAVFRLRRRGPATELAICALAADSRASGMCLVGSLLRRTQADYAVGVVGGHVGFGVTIPRGGPAITWRAVRSSDKPRLRSLGLTLGDLELF
ncbi:MAG: hypothetical protein KatS3mg008_0466 [Acidimicrobiales bacterium]|nr:MAG: hypothetical protein KatS3mg008_0466 [Acidimicrobiales bacterium]